MSDYVYAVRDKETKGIIDCKCKGGKYYTRKKNAENRCGGTREVVTYKLVEVVKDQEMVTVPKDSYDELIEDYNELKEEHTKHMWGNFSENSDVEEED